MKDMIISLLAGIRDKSLQITDAKYSIIGSCLNLDVVAPPDGYRVIKFTIERTEIIGALMMSGVIRGHDETTKQVYMSEEHGGGVARLHHVYADIKDFETLYRQLLQVHLESALCILDADEPAEELFLRYFNEYNIIEKQALLWRLADQTSITNYSVAQQVQHILNYMDGTTPTMPRFTNNEIYLFAHWMRENKCGLYGLCPPVADKQPSPTSYVMNVA